MGLCMADWMNNADDDTNTDANTNANTKTNTDTIYLNIIVFLHEWLDDEHNDEVEVQHIWKVTNWSVSILKVMIGFNGSKQPFFYRGRSRYKYSTDFSLSKKFVELERIFF